MGKPGPPFHGCGPIHTESNSGRWNSFRPLLGRHLSQHILHMCLPYAWIRNVISKSIRCRPCRPPLCQSKLRIQEVAHGVRGKTQANATKRNDAKHKRLSIRQSKVRSTVFRRSRHDHSGLWIVKWPTAGLPPKGRNIQIQTDKSIRKPRIIVAPGQKPERTNAIHHYSNNFKCVKSK